MSYLIRMRMNCYKIKIYCFRKAVIMSTPPPRPVPPFFRPLQAGWYVPLLCLGPFRSFWNMPQWQLVPPQSLWSPPSPSRVTYVLLSLSPFRPHPKQDPNPSIHIYAKQKAKVLCHFLVVDSCFSHNFIGMRPSASLGVCPSGHTQFSLIHSSHPSLSSSHSNVTHFIKLCNARIIAQIRTKRHNRWQSRKRKRKREKVPTGKLISLRKWLLLFPLLLLSLLLLQATKWKRWKCRKNFWNYSPNEIKINYKLRQLWNKQVRTATVVEKL